MTRRRLWSLTALACLMITLPSLPAAWRAQGVSAILTAADAVRGAVDTARRQGLPHLPEPDPRVAPIAIALASVLFGFGLLVRRQRRPVADVATGLAHRGRSIPAIARRTGLSQDAVRDLLGGDPLVVSTAVEGRFFRRVRRSVPAATGSFADELEEKSFDARA
jgi:hypothetical protein